LKNNSISFEIEFLPGVVVGGGTPLGGADGCCDGG